MNSTMCLEYVIKLYFTPYFSLFLNHLKKLERVAEITLLILRGVTLKCGTISENPGHGNCDKITQHSCRTSFTKSISE